jgi:hypothetical protein
MTRKSSDDSLARIKTMSNYCLHCWLEFTTLTDEERKTLDEIERHFMLKKLKLYSHIEG